jgi:hypothetical protein
MVTSIAQPARSDHHPAGGGTTVAAPHLSTARTATTARGVNVQDFLDANRIHIKDGSLFVDPYLVIHPRELAPENELALRKKLQLTYSINNPSFYESRERTAAALNLGQLVPVSPSAKRSKLMEEVKSFNAQLASGVDGELQKELDDKKTPMAAIARDVVEHPGSDPVGLELLQNSLAVYLLMREKLTKNGYLGKLTDYVQRRGTPDQVLADLADNIGVTPLQVREAGLKGGIDGIGQLLGLEPKYISDVKELAQYAATQDFSYNLVEHWHLGRQLQGLNAPMAEKISTGLDARITAKLAEFRDKIRHHFEVPAPIKNEEKLIAEALNLVDPIQRELMFRLGYEVCFSPEVNADDIAFFPGIYGLHRKAANDLRDVAGTYRIYFSGRGDKRGSQRTLVHEIAHNLWPEQFSAAEIKEIDALAASDQQRFTRFQKLMNEHYTEFERLFDAYKAGNTQEKLAITAVANEEFAAYGFDAEGLFPYLRTANDFRTAVSHAFETLSIEGDRYNRSGYNSPEERFREVISRFAELSQVEYRGEPQFLQFLAPGLNQIFEAHYLPHLARVNEAIKNGALPARHADAAVPPARVRDDYADPTSDTAPETEVQPKVAQRPVAEPTSPTQGTPVTPPATATPTVPAETHAHVCNAACQHACTADTHPLSQVSADTVQLNPNTLAALNTLSGMGIVQH